MAPGEIRSSPKQTLREMRSGCERFEDGPRAEGDRVKALQRRQGGLSDAYATQREGELWIRQTPRSEPYAQGNPTREKPRARATASS